MKILLPIDGSYYSKNAVASVAKCADTLCGKGTIILVNVVKPVLEEVNTELTDYELMGTRFTKVLLREFYDAESYELFEKARAQLHELRCHVEELTLVGNPAERIAEVAEKMNVDLIVMGSHGKGALRTMIFGSVTEGVIARTKKPVLLIRGNTINCKEAPKVGIAIGGSEYDAAMADFIVRYREFFGSQAHFSLIHVVEPCHCLHAKKSEMQSEHKAELQSEFNRVVDPIIPRLSEVGISAHAVCLNGNPVKELTLYSAEKRLDLLIMGSHGHRRFDLGTLGSTTLKVAEDTDVPLLIVHQQ